MATVIDSSLWVDYFRLKTPLHIKEKVAPIVESPEALLCEPIRFEILRAALRVERSRIEELFDTFPFLPTPSDLWPQAASLGQRAIDAGAQPRAMDLLIAAVCLHHGAALITFDYHFADLARISPLKVRVLSRT